MSEVIRTAEKEIMRKEILSLCQEAAPLGCSKEVLKAALSKIGIETSELDKEVNYLQGKKLLHVEPVGNARLGIQREICKITPEGTDYMDGNGPDIAGVGV